MKKGNITKRKKKNGDITYRISFMYKNERYSKTFSTRKACEAWEREVKNQVDQSGFYCECTKTLSDVIDEWWELDSDRLAPNTKAGYRSTIKKIKKYKIVKMEIAKIHYTDLQKFFNKLADQGNKKGTCETIKKILSHAFNLAIRSQYIEFNPLAYVKNKGEETKDPNKKQVLTQEELEEYMQYFKDGETFKFRSLYVLLAIGAYTGARISEALAIEWEDVDFYNNTITLDKKYERTEQVATTRMKTKASRATLPLVKPLKDILLEWRKENTHTLIICDESGKYLASNYAYWHFRSASKVLNIPFHFHMLRHGFGSLLMAKGVNVKDVQTLMRHSSIDTTLRTYIHTNEESLRDSMNSVFNTNYTKITQKGGDTMASN